MTYWDIVYSPAHKRYFMYYKTWWYQWYHEVLIGWEVVEMVDFDLVTIEDDSLVPQDVLNELDKHYKIYHDRELFPKILKTDSQ